jgi:hypothetical protein
MLLKCDVLKNDYLGIESHSAIITFTKVNVAPDARIILKFWGHNNELSKWEFDQTEIDALAAFFEKHKRK